MSWMNYKRKAEKLAERVESIYHKIGGSFLFVWVDDASKCTISFTATAHFADEPTLEIMDAWSNFFHATVKSNAENRSGINFWSIVDDRNVKRLIVTMPERDDLTTSRRATENIRQPNYIMEGLDDLKKEGLPFAFFYRLSTKSAANGHQAINEAFPEEPHGKELLESDGWKLMMKANKTLMPPMNIVIGDNHHIQTQAGPRPRGLVAPRQRNQVPAVVDGGVESSDELRRRYLQPFQDAGVTEDALLETMRYIMDSSSSSIPATLVRNDDDEIRVVMPNFIGDQEKITLVPVLVSAIRCIVLFCFQESPAILILNHCLQNHHQQNQILNLAPKPLSCR